MSEVLSRNELLHIEVQINEKTWVTFGKTHIHLRIDAGKQFHHISLSYLHFQQCYQRLQAEK